MRKYTNNYEDVEKELIKNGWEFSHPATVNRYMYSGYVGKMMNRKGYEYCRVHRGECVGKMCYQITMVYKRRIHE